MSPLRWLRWHARGSEFDSMGICRRNKAVGCGRWLSVSSGVDRGDVCEESIAATGNGLDKAWMLRRVAQRLTNLVDGFVKAMIEVDERLAPNFLAQFLPGYQLSGFFQQHRQDLKRLLLQPEAQATLDQFAGSKIDLEDSKPQPPASIIGLSHSRHKLARCSRLIAVPD